jgi:hypothetical protein
VRNPLERSSVERAEKDSCVATSAIFACSCPVSGE